MVFLGMIQSNIIWIFMPQKNLSTILVVLWVKLVTQMIEILVYQQLPVSGLF